MHIFYQPDIVSNPFLTDDESKHATRVLRLKINDEIQIYDGIGNTYLCKIKTTKGKKVEIEIIKKTEIPSAREFYLHIAISPTKNINRFEWFLEKATEIGIDEITPILTSRSERKNINKERLNRILISAIKQSKNPYLPKLNELVKFEDFITNISIKQKYIAHCIDNRIKSLKNAYKKANDTVILIGPEGDFTKEEVEMAVGNNISEINLGLARLRTETAGVVACHTINLINQ